MVVRLHEWRRPTRMDRMPKRRPQVPAASGGDLCVAAVLARDHLRRALPPDVAGCAAARRRHSGARQQRIDGDLAEAKRLKENPTPPSPPTRRRSRMPAAAPRRSPTRPARNTPPRPKPPARRSTPRSTPASPRPSRPSPRGGPPPWPTSQDIAVETAAAIVERLTGNAPANARRRQGRSPTHSSAEDRDDASPPNSGSPSPSSSSSAC